MRRGIFDRRIGGPFSEGRLCLLCRNWFYPVGEDVIGRRRKGRIAIYIVRGKGKGGRMK